MVRIAADIGAFMFAVIVGLFVALLVPTGFLLESFFLLGVLAALWVGRSSVNDGIQNLEDYANGASWADSEN